jgi:hypothetical protein
MGHRRLTCRRPMIARADAASALAKAEGAVVA